MNITERKRMLYSFFRRMMSKGITDDIWPVIFLMTSCFKESMNHEDGEFDCLIYSAFAENKFNKCSVENWLTTDHLFKLDEETIENIFQHTILRKIYQYVGNDSNAARFAFGDDYELKEWDSSFKVSFSDEQINEARKWLERYYFY
jgi:hypothetical protein